MAWSDPPDWTSSVLTSSQMDQYVSANLSYLKGVADGVGFSGAQLTRDANTSIADSTYSAITWTVESDDFGGWWSSGTNIVVPSGAIPAGFTRIMLDVQARARFASNGTGARRLRGLLDGTEFVYVSATGISGDTTDLDFSRKVPVTVGQVVTIEVYQSSGGALNASQMAVSVCRYAPLD